LLRELAQESEQKPRRMNAVRSSNLPLSKRFLPKRAPQIMHRFSGALVAGRI
jgi:hypothetical protein